MRNLGFLASTWASDEMRGLRRQIHQLGVEMNHSIWVAEHDAPELTPENDYDPLMIADRCLDEIEHAECFIIIIDGGIGTLVGFEKRITASSFIELELFHAVMHEKAIYVLSIGDIPEDAPSRRLLNLVSHGMHCEARYCRDYSEAFDVVTKIFQRLRLRSKLPWHRNKQFLTGRLALDKHSDFGNQRLFEEIQFLKGEPFIVADVNTDLDVVRSLLEDAKTQQHSNRKMTRTWLALRSLMHHHYAGSDDPLVLSLWEEGLRVWSKLAAWRGFHGHLWLGNIAALSSLSRVLERQGRSLNDDRGTQDSVNLGGAFSSVYYSLSKIAPRAQSESFLGRSALYAERALAEIDEELHSGIYAIRGSVNMKRGNRQNAVNDYTRALELAEMYQQSDAIKGERLAELGWAEFSNGKIRAGVAHMEEGVRIMDAADVGPGFRARGKRKLAMAQFLTLSIPKAYKTASSASNLIEEYGLYDQRDTFIRAADHLKKVIYSIRGSS